MATEQTLDSLNNANLKTVGEQAAFATGLSMQNQVSHQGAMNQIRELSMGNLAKKMTELDVMESLAVVKATSGNDVANQISALMAALAAGQSATKAAQTVPPVTP